MNHCASSERADHYGSFIESSEAISADDVVSYIVDLHDLANLNNFNCHLTFYNLLTAIAYRIESSKVGHLHLGLILVRSNFY